ncbi:MAG: sigma-70 family RNA polymerase sigma factor [Acidobacteria bacterium]|nr:sigma-70 family RNA polymerase sigma factor [Acidobacteriota bacterium]
MGEDARQDITGLLRAYSQGDRTALDRLIPLVESHLRQIAHRYLKRRRANETLQTTELLNETYLRLIGCGTTDWRDRAHFFALCARMMRGILVDHARARHCAKRAAGASPLPLDERLALPPQPTSDLVAIDEALAALAEFDPRKAQVIELRFFGGLTVEEVAEVLQVHPNTVKRDWRLAKLWLVRELNGESPNHPGAPATA